MSRLGGLGHRLYSGDSSFHFIGHRKAFYLASAIVVLIAIAAVLVRGLSFSIEFRGGVDFQTPVASSSTAQDSVSTMRKAVNGTGLPGAAEPTVTTIGKQRLRIQTEALKPGNLAKVRAEIADTAGVSVHRVAYSSIGPSWGDQITDKAARALVVFLALVMLVIWIYFREWRMAVSAILALFHDLIVTVGIYALVGFEVTPGTVIGLLTILGYSLYDTVVVFDKVRENSRGISAGSRTTYSEAANLAVNQTVARSINTSVIALLPVGGILFVGAGLLGAGTLKDLSLALFIGIAAGAYSSIFIATPLLCDLKEREPAMRALSRRVEQRRAGTVRTESGRASDRDAAEASGNAAGAGGTSAEPAAAGSEASGGGGGGSGAR